MARPIRIEEPWAFYHITSRGVARQEIFSDDSDRKAFLGVLADAHEKWGLVFHAYCLMGNHYHLEIQSPEGHLSRPIQWINQKYAGHVNRRYRRVGHLFQGRFKSVMVEAGRHLRELTRYIHLNPVRANLVERPADYGWSSYRAYLGLRKRPGWLRTETTLKRFGSSIPEQRRGYRAFVEQEIASDPFADLKFGAILGGEKFVEWARAKLRGSAEGQDASELSALKRARAPADLDFICAFLCDTVGIDERQLSVKGRWKNDDRDLAMYLAARHSGRRLTEIGERFGGIRASAVSHARKRIEHRMVKDRELRRKVEALSAELQGRARKL